MKKETYEEANALQYQINELKGENEMLEDVSEQLAEMEKTPKEDKPRELPVNIEVWVEKDAISSVLKRVTEKYGINILVNRGYGSVTAIKDAYDRFYNEISDSKDVVILYLGDHDPSGLDMIRDINARVSEMLAYDGYDHYFEIIPIALTMEQIKKYSPPPNPAKITDSRSPKYIEQYGRVSWEVDALPPEVLNKVLDDAILEHLDMVENSDSYKEIDEMDGSWKEAENYVDNVLKLVRPRPEAIKSMKENSNINNKDIAETAILDLREAIDQNDTSKILQAYNLVEQENFSWHGLPEYLFEEWDKMIDEANDLLF